MSHLSELVYLHSGGSVDQSSEVLVHIFGRPKLLNGLKSAVELVTQNRYNIETRDHPFFINQGLSLLKIKS